MCLYFSPHFCTLPMVYVKQDTYRCFRVVIHSKLQIVAGYEWPPVLHTYHYRNDGYPPTRGRGYMFIPVRRRLPPELFLKFYFDGSYPVSRGFKYIYKIDTNAHDKGPNYGYSVARALDIWFLWGLLFCCQLTFILYFLNFIRYWGDDGKGWRRVRASNPWYFLSFFYFTNVIVCLPPPPPPPPP